MPSNHRQNHDFQIAYFLAGACHTPDAAYAMLLDLKENRRQALDNYDVVTLKNQAKRLRAKAKLNGDQADRLEAQAEIMELDNAERDGKVLHEAALAELDFIKKCIAKVEPLRKYKGMTDAEAIEAAQREEWKLELVSRAENFLLTSGTIPPDHFATMRQHPDFKDDILPAVTMIQKQMKSPEDVKVLEYKEPWVMLLE